MTSTTMNGIIIAKKTTTEAARASQKAFAIAHSSDREHHTISRRKLQKTLAFQHPKNLDTGICIKSDNLVHWSHFEAGQLCRPRLHGESMSFSGTRGQIVDEARDASKPYLATADDGTTQTLTAAMVTGGNPTVHVSAGGSTPSLTMPLATAIIAAISQWQIGQSFVLRVINSNSGTATVVTNTGITTSGTLTLATNTWRDFLVKMTAAGTISMTSIGTGTNS